MILIIIQTTSLHTNHRRRLFREETAVRPRRLSFLFCERMSDVCLGLVMSLVRSISGWKLFESLWLIRSTFLIELN